MDIKIEGKIIQVLPPQGGVSKAGKDWRKQEYILETQETYPKKVCFNFFNERIDQFPMKAGDEVVVYVDIESREFNGRWYTDVRGYKVEPKSGGAPGPVPPANDPIGLPGDFPPAPADLTPTPGATDDLPF